MLNDKYWQQIIIMSFFILAALIISASLSANVIPLRSRHYKANYVVASRSETERIKMLINLLAPDISHELVLLAKSESAFDQWAIGLSGEIGLFQIKPSTARTECGINDKSLLFELIPNILCAADYWRKVSHKSFSETFYAWNLGPYHKYNTKQLKCTDPKKSAKCHLNNLLGVKK